MALKDYSTITSEQIDLFAQRLARRTLPIIERFEPAADFEELITFAAQNSTPVVHGGRNPAWRLEPVAARLIEALAIAAHEATMLEADWKRLAQISLEHAEYLYTYHQCSRYPRERLQAGATLALVGCVCHVLPQSTAWRMTGFSQVAEEIESVEGISFQRHLVAIIDAAFDLGFALGLPIVGQAIDRYNAVLHRALRWEKREAFQLNDPDSQGQREQLLKRTLRRYKSLHDRCFLPDGFQIEGSSQSHYEAFTDFSHFYHFVSVSQPHFIRDFSERFEKSIEVFMYLSQPDYHLPLLGDSADYIHVGEPCRIGYALFNRADFLYMASEGKRGMPPAEISHAFPYAGYYVMRNGWGADALYLVFDGGHLGSVYKSGNLPDLSRRPHEDRLNFILYAYGRPLIIDPGICQGDEAFESYFRSSRGHNCVLVDGKGECRRLMAVEEIQPDPDTRWLTTPSFDFVEGWYKDGYAQEDGGGLDCDLQHKRSIFYAKGTARSSSPDNGEYFIFHDLILGEGEHTLEQIFHISPVPGDRAAAVEVMENRVARTVAPGNSNLVIAPVEASGLEAQLIGELREENSPEEDLFAHLQIGSFANFYSAPLLIYKATRSLPTVMNTVLFPLRPGLEMMPTVKPIGVSADADVLATGFTVSHGQWVDLILVSDDGFATMRTCPSAIEMRGERGPPSISEVEFVGEYLLLRLDAQGELLQAAMINGQFLRVSERVLVDLPEPQESYVIY